LLIPLRIHDNIFEQVREFLETMQREASLEVNPSDNEPYIELDTIISSSNSQSTVSWNDAVRRQPPSSGEGRCVLPLAEVASPLFRYNVLRGMFEHELTPPKHLLTMVDWITTDSLSSILSARDLRKERIEDCITRVVTFDVNDLIASGTVESLRGTTLSNILTAPVFTVPKSDGKSSRFILDGRCFDELFKSAEIELPPMPLPQIPVVVDDILSGWKVISTCDAKSMFFQFSLVPCLRKFFGFTFGAQRNCTSKQNEPYRMCALPMGVCFAPTFAQHISNYICAVVRCRVVSSIRFQLFAWVDNFILLTNSCDDDSVVRTVFDMVTGELHLVMKMWEGGSSTLDALGISFNLDKRSASPMPTKQQQIRNDCVLLRQSLSENSCVNNMAFMRWFGMVQWISYSTSRLPLCFCPAVMRLIRDIHGTMDWYGKSYISSIDDLLAEITRVSSACITIAYTPRSCSSASTTSTVASSSSSSSDCVFAGLQLSVSASTTTLGDIVSVRPSVATTTTIPLLIRASLTSIWTDASTSAIAAVHPLRRLAFTHPIVCTHRQICAAELIAGMCGFVLFGSADVWVTDNLPAARAVARGHSGSVFCDEILRAWFDTGCFPTYVQWVDTACQIADSLTRLGETLQHKPCASQHSWFRVRWRKEGAVILTRKTRSADLLLKKLFS
jgi:hypothetical protein